MKYQKYTKDILGFQVSQYSKDQQFHSDPKIIFYFGGTNNILLTVCVLVEIDF